MGLTPPPPRLTETPAVLSLPTFAICLGRFWQPTTSLQRDATPVITVPQIAFHGDEDGIDPFLGDSSLFPDSVNKISNHSSELHNSTTNLQHFWQDVGAARCLPILQLSRTLATSADVGRVPRSASVSLCLTSASSAPSNWVLTFSTLVKGLLQRWCCSVGVLQGSPLSSQMATTVVGTRPLLPNCIYLTHFHTFFPQKTLSFCLLCLGF